jgi:hypothetical protein
MVERVQAERLDPEFAQLSPNRNAQLPVRRNHEHNRHPVIRIQQRAKGAARHGAALHGLNREGTEEVAV